MKYPAFAFRFLSRSLLYAGLYGVFFLVGWEEHRVAQSVAFGIFMAGVTFANATRQPGWKEAWVLTQPEVSMFSLFSDPLFTTQAFREVGENMNLRLKRIKTQAHRVVATWEGKLGEGLPPSQLKAILICLNAQELELSIECRSRRAGRQWQAFHKAEVHRLYAELTAYFSPTVASTPGNRQGP
jgi:hypothetical protein